MKNMKLLLTAILIILFGLLCMVPNTQAQSSLTNGLLAYLPFNGNGLDVSGNGNNATLNNLTTTNGNTVYSSALYFNGTNGFAVIPNVPALNPTNISFSVWVNPNPDNPSFSTVCSKHQAGVNNDGSWFLAISGQQLAFWANDYAVFPEPTPPNTWTHCVLTCNCTSGQYSVYSNGTLLQQGTKYFVLGSNNLPVSIGVESATMSSFYKGSLEYFRLYNRVLSSNEVAQIYLQESHSFAITQDLFDTTVVLSSNASFAVSFKPDQPVTYQWYFYPSNFTGQAGAYAETIAGFVYGTVVTNGGVGYGNIPSVSFVGGGGSGAAGYAVVSNAAVAGIIVTNAGFGYATVPSIVIGPPDGLLFGATNGTLNITNANSNNVGRYFVVIKSNGGSITSSVATLTVLYPPSIGSQPQDVYAHAHDNATFEVNASGTPPLSYFWQFMNLPMSNGTNLTLVVSNFIPV